ncbi:MAG TPA: hypothetical protein VG826_32840 [Pirellulales bacterium]|nr:hypothetical protein [Pirellulales bacterium]
MIAVAALTVRQTVVAQDLSNRADRKITGEYFRPHTASSYQRSAITHSEALNYYGQRYSQLPSETVKEHTGEIKRTLDAAKKEYTKLGKEAKGNKAVEQHLAKINEPHTKASEIAEKLETAQTGSECAEHCAALEKELKAAEAANEKLEKTLGIGAKEEATKK